MKTKKFIFTIFLSIALFVQSSCSSKTNSSGTAQNDKITITASSIEKKLGTESTATIKVKAADFSGTVTLEIDRTDLDSAFAADDDIVLSLDTSSVTVTANQTAEVTLNINIKTHAPSFKSIDNGGDGKIKIIATLPDNEKLNLDVPFQVDAIYEVRLSIDSMSGDHVWDRPLVESMRHHDGDLTVVFINTDDVDPHGVHANGAIDHQAGSMAAASAAGEDGGKYEAIVDQDQNSSSYYCHTHNDTAHTNTINFND